jgi:hypothetical protein
MHGDHNICRRRHHWSSIDATFTISPNRTEAQNSLKWPYRLLEVSVGFCGGSKCSPTTNSSYAQSLYIPVPYREALRVSPAFNAILHVKTDCNSQCPTLSKHTAMTTSPTTTQRGGEYGHPPVQPCSRIIIDPRVHQWLSHPIPDYRLVSWLEGVTQWGAEGGGCIRE